MVSRRCGRSLTCCSSLEMFPRCSGSFPAHLRSDWISFSISCRRLSTRKDTCIHRCMSVCLQVHKTLSFLKVSPPASVSVSRRNIYYRRGRRRGRLPLRTSVVYIVLSLMQITRQRMALIGLPLLNRERGSQGSRYNKLRMWEPHSTPAPHSPMIPLAGAKPGSRTGVPKSVWFPPLSYDTEKESLISLYISDVNMFSM